LIKLDVDFKQTHLGWIDGNNEKSRITQ